MIRNISFNLGQMLNRCQFLSNTPLSVAEHLETDKKWIQHAQRFSVEHNSILKSSKKGRVACLVKQSIKREADVLKANSSFLHPSLLRSMGYLSRSGGRRASPTTVLGFGGLHVPGLWVRLIVLKKPQFLNISMPPC